MPSQYNTYVNARDAFIAATLRQESGAVIKDDEFWRQERIFFPQPGETPRQIEEKRQLRAGAIRRMEEEAGPSYQPPDVKKLKQEREEKLKPPSAVKPSQEDIRRELIRRGALNDRGL